MSLPTPSLIKANGPLEIPEILGLIARYLSVKDLARCAQVSRFWNTVFHLRMWHTFDDSIEPWNTILEMASRTSLDTIDFVKSRYYESPADNRGMDEAWVRSVIGKNAKHIRRLTTRWALTLEACVQSGECTNVTALKASIIPECNSSNESPPYISQWEHWVPDIPASFFVSENNPEGTLEEWYHPHIARALRFMWQFILHNPGLEEVILSKTSSSDFVTFVPPKPFLYNALQSLTRLRRLEGLNLDEEDFGILQELMPNLEHFTSGHWNREYMDESVTKVGIDALKDVNTKMRVINFQVSISAKHQAKILECMPELQELHVGRRYSGSERTNLQKKVHINADSLRLWSVPHLYCLLHPMITHSTKNLQELRIQMVNYGVNGLVELLRRINPNLQVVDIDCFVSYPIEDWYSEVALPLPPVLNLQETLPQFNLRSLRLSGLSSPHVMFAPARQRGEKIVEQSEELTAGSAWWACLPNLTEFVTQCVAPATLVGIVDNCPQIEVLDLSLVQKGFSAITYVLAKCVKLKSFVGKGHTIDASHVVQGPAWVCRDIERLHIEVHGIPRVGEQGQGASEVVALDTRARDLSIGVYERIGQLTKLRELDLGGYMDLPDRLEHPWVGSNRKFEMSFGVVNNIHPVLKNSLELSLVSGLDRLAGLKKLRRIGVQEVDICVGQEEVEWMKEHWQLESWVGLSPFSAGGSFYNTKHGQTLKFIKEAWPSIRLH